MKQDKLIKEVYKACIEHNAEKLRELRIEEFRKILKHKHKSPIFSAKWSVVQL